MEHNERLTRALAGLYRIEREIGSGGMATVYLAQDLKHDRKVAVKVMRPELTADMGADRFLAEIRTTATLSHPHILPLHDSGEADGFLFYVMPYVEGESLRERLDRDGQLPVEEAVRIAGHVAEALDYAHRQGVIHRDIKPANILFEDEQPVVTDFGIAVALSAAGEGRLTETGFYLGTPHYISPEQAAGDRTPTAAWDVYSLGCVLYEMLTGDPPHTGSSPQAILGKIFLGEVTLPTKLRHTIPPHVEGVILKALERLPADRFRSTVDLAAALNDKSFRHGGEVETGAPAGIWNWLSISLGVATVLALAAAVTGIFAPEPSPPSILKQEIRMPGGVDRFLYWGNYTALAPDGSSMLYRDTVGPGDDWQYWVKERGSVEGRPLPRTTGADGVAYSPNGDWIVYRTGTDLVKRSLQGAGAETILEGVTTASGDLHPHWMADGTILLNQAGGILLRVHEDGGAPPDTVFLFPEDFPVWVRGLPGKEAALVVRCMGPGCRDGWNLSVVAFEADTTWVLENEVRRAWYVPTGHVVWVGREGAVFAAPFDLDRLEMSDAPELLFEGVRRSAHHVDMVMGRDGTVAYVEALEFFRNQLMWVDRHGDTEPVDPDWEPGYSMSPALSPDGRYLAVNVSHVRNLGSEIWVKELPRGPAIPLTEGRVWHASPAWAPDGNTIIFGTYVDGAWDLYSIRPDVRSSGTGRLLLDLESSVAGEVYTPGGQGIVFRSGGGLRYLDLTTGNATIESLATEFPGRDVSLSPDGRWMAYNSDVNGRSEVFVSPFPDVESRWWLVSINGGRYPLWARNGRELFYRGGDHSVMVATYSADSVFTVEHREQLFDPGFPEASDQRDWDIAPSGDRFIMLSPDLARTRAILVLNLFTQLEERAGG